MSLKPLMKCYVLGYIGTRDTTFWSFALNTLRLLLVMVGMVISSGGSFCVDNSRINDSRLVQHRKLHPIAPPTEPRLFQHGPCLTTKPCVRGPRKICYCPSGVAYALSMRPRCSGHGYLKYESGSMFIRSSCFEEVDIDRDKYCI